MGYQRKGTKLADAVVSNEPRVHRAKLLAPSTAMRTVPRAAIAELIARSLDAKLILFRAPAGFGKTSAMAQYMDVLRSTGRAAAWLTLDPLDDDFRRLLLHLVAAFDQVLATPGASGPGRAKAPAASSVDEMAPGLMDRIADCDHPFTLFIDDFESVSNRSLDDLMRLILARIPPGGQLVIASRRMPALQVGRLRAQGQLVEVDHLRLRFSREEAETMMATRSGLVLSKQNITKLHTATEGWPAALWLAATAMENRDNPDSFIASFSGSNTAIVEYLAENVLYRQTDDIQSFLLKTSILGELNKSLCDAVCEREDSDSVLRQLEQSNACVTLVDDQQQLYRYHGLFAGFLRDQLGRLYPESIAELHLRAARWYEQAGRGIRAIEHALAADNLGYALPLIETHADDLLFQGRFNLLAQWLDALPRETVDSRQKLRAAHIWALTFTRRAAEALRLLDASTGGATAQSLAEEEENELQFLRPFILTLLDQHAEGYWIAGEMLPRTPRLESFSYHMMMSMMATWKVAANQYREGVELLSYTSSEPENTKRPFPRVYAICLEGSIDLIQCRVREGIGHFRVALRDATAKFGGRSIRKSVAATYLAESLYEIDQIEEAEQLLALYLPIALEYAHPDMVIVAHILQARIAYARDDLDHAFQRLSELESFGRDTKLPRLLASAQLERARIALLGGDVKEAQLHFERASNPAAWAGLGGMSTSATDVESVALCRYRLAVHGVDREDALPKLRADIKTAQAGQRNRRALKLQILLGRLLHDCGQQRLAMRTMQEALQVAAREGMTRTFLDEGAPILDMLRDLRVARHADAAGLAESDELGAFMDRVLARGGYAASPLAASREMVSGASELTARELQFLESLSLGLSNGAIANKLFVSETTVRSHLRKINVKLGASNRTQAVTMGRRLGLIK